MTLYPRSPVHIDDIIEHIIKRLNTDFTGCYLYISDFCGDMNGGSDIKMTMKVYAKMRIHKVCTEDESESNPYITITAKGIDVYDNGGWKKYMEEIKAEKEAKAKEEEKAKKREHWVRKSTIISSLFTVLAFFWGIYLYIDNKEKDVQIKELKDSLIIGKRANQLLKVAKEKKSSKIIIPVQKHDSLGHTTK